jgi:hypothetical protein
MAITVPIVSEWQPKGVNKAVADFQKLEGAGKKLGFALEKAFVPATAALGALAAGAVFSAKAAADDQRAQAELERQIKASTTATEEQTAATLDFIRAQELASAISSDELRPALSILVRHTNDLGKAQELLALAMDVSVGTGRDVFDVAERMAEGFTGVLTPLEELDYGLVQSIENGASFDDIMNDLADTFGGAVANDAQTAAGQFARMQVQLGQTVEEIGYALLPIIEKLLPYLESMATWVGENTDLIIGIGTAVGLFASAIVAANIAMKAWTVISGITAVMNRVLTKEFTALWVATGIGIILAIIAVVVTLQMKFDILGKAVDGLTWLFDYLWDKAKIVLAGIVDGINIMIEAWNKLPLVPDIPLIEAGFLKIEKAAESVGTTIEAQVEPFQLFTDSVAESTIEAEISAAMLEQALIPAVEKVGVSFDTAKWELMAFYDQIDREDAFAKFQEELAEVSEELTGLEPGSAEFEQNMRDAYNAVRALSNELGYIPAELEKTLLYRIEIGDIAGAERLAGLISAGDTYRATASDELRFLGGLSQSPSGIVNNVTVNAGMGTDGASVGRQIVEALNTYGASGGAQISSALVR